MCVSKCYHSIRMEIDKALQQGVKRMKRIFLIVLDSVGIGEMPDAANYGDEGSHTEYAASH